MERSCTSYAGRGPFEAKGENPRYQELAEEAESRGHPKKRRGIAPTRKGEEAKPLLIVKSAGGKHTNGKTPINLQRHVEKVDSEGCLNNLLP